MAWVLTQMNRIGSAEIALKQAQNTLKEEGKDIMTEGLVLASDGFFPFNDCVALAAEYGIKAIVQPGGSIRDEDSIKLANEKGITMLFTYVSAISNISRYVRKQYPSQGEGPGGRRRRKGACHRGCPFPFLTRGKNILCSR